MAKKPQTMQKPQLAIVDKINNLKAKLLSTYVERDDVIESLYEALLARMHVMLIGPPGTAKSALIKDMTSSIQDSKYFYIQVMQSTKPEEMFGNLSLKQLKNDKYERILDNKLADCHIANIDEVFHCNSGLLQGMNEILNERTFQGQNVPLLIAFGATNWVPDDEQGLVAFYDRWEYRFVVPDIRDDSNFKAMLLAKNFTITDAETVSIDEIKELQTLVDLVDVSGVIKQVVRLRKDLRDHGIEPTARRWKWSLKAIAAHAVLDGRLVAQEEDIRVLQNILWEEQDQISKIATLIGKVIDPMLQDLKSYVIQAQDIEKRLQPLSPKIESEAIQINEGIEKLRNLVQQIETVLGRRDLAPRVRNIAELMQKRINKIRLSIMDSKFNG